MHVDPCDKEDCDSDDHLEWADEISCYQEVSDTAECWKVMIVDDDEAVHSVTRLALRNFSFEGKGLQFISAYSAAQAYNLITQHADLAIILLDVVMEEDDAGLKVARFIREEVKNSFVRIILRTGQAGQAPEEQVIIGYDINDYKEKTELTSRKLFTTIVSSLRAYRDIITLEANRQGLEKIIEASASIFKVQSMTKFVSGVLKQLVSLLGLNKNSLYCHTSGFAAAKSDGQFRILAATGDFEKHIDESIHKVLPEDVLNDLNAVFAAKESMFFGTHYVGYCHSNAGSESIIYLEGLHDLKPLHKDLITVFFNNVSTAFDNIYLNQELSNDQIELLFTLGEMAESRSHETGIHIKSVARYSKLFAEKYGLCEEECAAIELAASMHDIGKLAIEDSILKKPGILTPEEFAKIQQHSDAGYKILHSSSRPLLKTAAIIALQHHEKYDGSGYPQGLSGKNIHIYGRITAIADVFDALSSDRVYRKAWDSQHILEHIKNERGKHFDPELVDIFFNNLGEFLNIKNSI